MRKRGSGIILHITSLPSQFGIGDFGPEAYKFVDTMVEARQGFWQILPLSQTSPGTGNSPYSSGSAFARNIYFISPELLVRDGYLADTDIESHPDFPQERVDYGMVIDYKMELYRKAYENVKSGLDRDHEFQHFCRDNAFWLDDYALFLALQKEFNYIIWSDWPIDLRDRAPSTLGAWTDKMADTIVMEKFLQYIFYRQWTELREYANSRGVLVIGDIPLYTDYNSATVWASPHVFKLDEAKKPVFIAGVPPDYFSETGQLWGNPVYQWDAMRHDGYAWWIRRLRHNFRLYDLLRLDHFRGLVAYWEVNAGEKTAISGKWVATPIEDFLNTLLKHLATLPIIAEDLGIITPDVREIMQMYGFPGMRILMFAFGADMPSNDYSLHNHVKNCIVYPGTHDNNTARGWFSKDATPEEKERLTWYLGRAVTEENVHWELIRLAMMSVAQTSIYTMQDVLGLGDEARMNKPGSALGNWEWRLLPGQFHESLVRQLAELTEVYGRA